MLQALVGSRRRLRSALFRRHFAPADAKGTSEAQSSGLRILSRSNLSRCLPRLSKCQGRKMREFFTFARTLSTTFTRDQGEASLLEDSVVPVRPRHLFVSAVRNTHVPVVRLATIRAILRVKNFHKARDHIIRQDRWRKHRSAPQWRTGCLHSVGHG
jgi:hypothetical protein